MKKLLAEIAIQKSLAEQFEQNNTYLLKQNLNCKQENENLQQQLHETKAKYKAATQEIKEISESKEKIQKAFNQLKTDNFELDVKYSDL